MTDTQINALLAQVLDLLAQDAAPSTFDFEQALLGLGSSPAEAELLADYIPSACGRAFLREIGIIPSDTYRRLNKDGSWGPPQRFSDDRCGEVSSISLNLCEKGALSPEMVSCAPLASPREDVVGPIVNEQALGQGHGDSKLIDSASAQRRLLLGALLPRGNDQIDPLI